MIKVIENGLSGIPSGAKVIINSEIVNHNDGIIKLNVEYSEVLDARIYDGSDDGLVIKIPCAPENNSQSGAHKIDQYYVRMRLGEDGYPPIGEQLDALWKGGSDFAKMQQEIADVKRRYPKA